MNIGLFGIDFPHSRGDFCIRMASPHYTVCSFDTDFLYEKDGALAEGNRGDLLIMEPWEIVYHGPRKDAKEGFVNDWIHIKGDDFRQLLERYPLPKNTAFPIGKAYPLRPFLEQLQTEFHCPEEGRSEIIDSILTQMVIHVYRDYQHYNTQPTSRSVSIAVEAIAQNPGHDWRLAELSDMCGYSVSRFSEIFRQQYGHSPMQHVLQQRIHLAKRYLLSGQASIGYIAEVCGFQSPNYFCKYFKQVVGCPPSRYLACQDAQEHGPTPEIERQDQT